MSARNDDEHHAADERFTVALQGFSEFERNALASFFRLAADRKPSYQQVQRIEESHFIIVDADHPSSVRALAGSERQGDAVYIGSRAPDGAASWLRRPIEPTRIVRELDSLVALRRASLPVSLADLADRATQAGRVPSAVVAPLSIRLSTSDSRFSSMPAPRETPGPRVEPLAMPVVTSRAPAARRAVIAPAEAPSGPDVLVAEDSRIARRFLQLRLQRLGYRVHLASDGDEALEQFTQRRFELVFVDVELGSVGSIDGFSLCQHLKQHPDLAGGRAPKVMIVTGSTSASDRVRGQLAGCDAYLVKPLVEADFMKALHQLDPGLRARRKVAQVDAGSGAGSSVDLGADSGAGAGTGTS